MIPHRVAPGRQGSGRADWTNGKRVAVFLEAADFQKVTERAAALEVGNSEIVRRIVSAWCAGEPPPMLVGAGEHS